MLTHCHCVLKNQSPRAAETNQHILRWLKTTKIHSLSVLEAESPKSSVGKIASFLGAQKECLFHAFPQWSPAVLVHAHFRLCSHFHIAVLPMSSYLLPLQDDVTSPFLVRTPVVLDVEPTFLQYDLISSNYICKDLFSK